MSFDTTLVYKCEDCNKLYEAEAVRESGPLYECGGCGEVFNKAGSLNDNHQCPQCNKFGSKLADVSCPEGCDGELLEIDAAIINGRLYVDFGAVQDA